MFSNSDFAFFIFFSFIYVRVVSTTQSDSNHCENSYFATITVKNTFFRIIAAKNLYIKHCMLTFFINKTEKDYACIFSFSSRVAQKKNYALICPDEELSFNLGFHRFYKFQPNVSHLRFENIYTVMNKSWSNNALVVKIKEIYIFN